MKVQIFAKFGQNDQIYVPSPSTTGWTELDCIDADPIRLTLSIDELADITMVSSVFSRSFQVPSTVRNEQFFATAFMVTGTNFNATTKADAYIQVNGQFFTAGNIRLQKIQIDEKTGSPNYLIIFMGQTSDFSSQVGSKLLTDLNFTHLNHTRNYANILDSWTADPAVEGSGFLGGDILYPLIEWGYTYDDDNVPLENVMTIRTVSPTRFTLNTNPLAQYQFKPVIRLRAIWDQIFAQAGYTYTSPQFFDLVDINNMYVITEQVARARLVTDNTFGQVQWTPQDSPLNGNINNYAWQNLNFTAPVSAPAPTPVLYVDDGFNFNLETSRYNTPVSGLYEFEVEFEAYNLGLDVTPGNYAYILFQLCTFSSGNPEQIETILDSNQYQIDEIYPTTSSGTYTTPSIWIPEGSNVGIRVRWAPGYTDPADNGPFGQILVYAKFSCTSATSEISITRLLPTNTKQIDFLKSIIQTFKLVLIPDKAVKNRFIIEPWDTWVNNAEIERLDWTDKLDVNKVLDLTPTFQTQQRDLVFQWDEDTADQINDGFKTEVRIPFGWYRYYSGIDIITGESIIKPILTSQPLAYVDGSANWVIPQVHGVSASGDTTQYPPILPKLRLVYYNGLVTSEETWYLADDVDAAQPQTTYPLVSHLSAWAPTDTNIIATANDLNWANMTQFSLQSSFVADYPQTGNSLFTKYWASYVNEIYSPWSRILQANFKLNPTDIFNFSFNNVVWVKDQWWRVKKIKDWQFNGETLSTSCELITAIATDLAIPVLATTTTTAAPCACKTWTCENTGEGPAVITWTSCEGELGETTVNGGQTISVCACNSPASADLDMVFTNIGPCGTTTTTTTVAPGCVAIQLDLFMEAGTADIYWTDINSFTQQTYNLTSTPYTICACAGSYFYVGAFPPQVTQVDPPVACTTTTTTTVAAGVCVGDCIQYGFSNIDNFNKSYSYQNCGSPSLASDGIIYALTSIVVCACEGSLVLPPGVDHITQTACTTTTTTTVAACGSCITYGVTNNTASTQGFSYIDCSNVAVSASVGANGATQFCACIGSITSETLNNLTVSSNGQCGGPGLQYQVTNFTFVPIVVSYLNVNNVLTTTTIPANDYIDVSAVARPTSNSYISVTSTGESTQPQTLQFSTRANGGGDASWATEAEACDELASLAGAGTSSEIFFVLLTDLIAKEIPSASPVVIWSDPDASTPYTDTPISTTKWVIVQNATLGTLSVVEWIIDGGGAVTVQTATGCPSITWTLFAVEFGVDGDSYCAFPTTTFAYGDNVDWDLVTLLSQDAYGVNPLIPGVYKLEAATNWYQSTGTMTVTSIGDPC